MARFTRLVVVSLGAVTMAGIAIPLAAQQKPASGPVARYDMRAGTISGFTGMNPMSMVFGGGRPSVQHELLLRLGSSQTPDKGAARADHFMPTGAKLGKSVALNYKADPAEPDQMQMPQKPKGRLLIYWGCAEHAPKGQPVVIDFAKVAAGQVPQGVWNSTVIRDWGPTPANSKSFGRWPSDDGKYIKSNSSLIGDHRIASNYAPEINFHLANDFMAPLNVTVRGQPSGATHISWPALPNATGYLAFLFGGKQEGSGQTGDMVMWTSSSSRQFGGGLSDWLTPSQVSGLVRDGTVLAPTTKSCVIPAEVKRDAPDFRMGTLTAFGPMEDFSHPPRPADPKTPWHLQWTARVRHKSTTSWMDAQGMMMGGGQSPSQQGTQRQCKPKRGGLGGMLGGVLGGGDGC